MAFFCNHPKHSLSQFHENDSFGLLQHILEHLTEAENTMALNFDRLNENLARVAASATRIEAEVTNTSEAADQAAIDSAADTAGSIADGIDAASPAPVVETPPSDAPPVDAPV